MTKKEINKGDYVRHKSSGKFGCVKGFDDNGNCVVLTLKNEYTVWSKRYVRLINDAKE